MSDFGSMTEEELDAAIFNNPSEHDGDDYDTGSESGNAQEGDVSPLDDANEQVDEVDVDTDVGQSTEADEDLEGSLSTDEDDIEGELDGATEEDEASEGTPEDELDIELDADNEPIAFQPLRASGKEYPIENLQELYTFASKGIDADKKWAESAEGRKVASTMKANGLDMNDLNLFIEAKGGNKDAIMSLLKANDIDPLDIDADAFNGYTPKDHSTGDFELALDDVVGRIKDKPRYEESVNVVMKEWDTRSRDTFYNDPSLLEKLNIDMQVDPTTGVSIYDRVAPLAEKLKILDNGSKTDLDYYMQAGKRVLGDLDKQNAAKADAEQKTQQAKARKQAEIEKRKKAAASTGGKSAGKQAVDVSEMSDEELDKLLADTN